MYDRESEINKSALKSKVLLICSDINFNKRIKEDFNENKYLFEIDFLNIEESFFKNIQEDIELIIFDNSTNSLSIFLKNLFDLTNKPLKIPVIIIQDTLNRDVDYKKTSCIYTLMLKNIESDLLFHNIDICLEYLLFNDKIVLESGFYFDDNMKILFRNKQIINLTKLETKLFSYLFKNRNKVVSYEEIEKFVWQGKKFSIFSLRNMIKNIRTKTEDNFIKNYSNHGYMINSL